MKRLIVAVVLLCALGQRARADEREAFYRGVALDRDGKPEEAARLYQDLVERAPTDTFADDALIELGRLYEEKLGDPVKAAEAYERLVRDFPTSRLAVRAGKRAAFLRGAMGADARSAKVLAELNDILYQMAHRPREESIARMERLVAENPDFPAAPRAVFWLGERAQEDGRLDAALARYRDVVARWPDSEWEPRARKAIGDVYVARGELDRAAASYRTLSGRNDAALDAVVRESLGKVERERWRWRAYVASWIILALFPVAMLLLLRRATGSWRAALRALARPPVEVLYFVPVAILFALAAMTEHAALGHAIELIMAGGLIIIWLAGAVLARTRPTIPRFALELAATGLAVAALCYLAVHRERLIDMLVETIKYGAEK